MKLLFHLPKKSGSTVLALLCLSQIISGQVELSATQIAQKALPAVVLVLCAGEGDDSISQGSGFFIEPGIVITNYHVIEGMSRGLIQVAVGPRKNKQIFRIARIIGFDEEADLAILSVPAASKPEIPSLRLVSHRSKIEVGETIFALGNPEGLVGTITQGIVSAGERSNLKKARIQISAPISEGSSGGPVLNRFGQVVGVAVGSLTKGQNLNFAVPASLVYSLYLTSEFPTALHNQLDVGGNIDDSRPRRWNWPLAPGSGRGRSLNDVTTGITADRNEIPATSQAYFERGIRLSEEKRYKEAITDFTFAIKLNPRSAGAYVNRGAMYGLLGQIQLEIADYNKAIEINPKFAHAYFNRGTAYGKQKNVVRELADYSQAIRLDPNFLLLIANEDVRFC